MKKILASIVLIFCLTLIAKAGDDKFIDALRNCSYYHDSGTVNIQGLSVVSTKSISGWNNDKCTYRENVKLNGADMNITCKFTKPQIKEITSVAEIHHLLMLSRIIPLQMYLINIFRIHPFVHLTDCNKIYEKTV